MPTTFQLPLISVMIEREDIPVDTIHPQKVPDEKWRFVDAAGHGHFWETGEEKTFWLPTLEWVVTGTEWVGEGSDAEEIKVGEYRCKTCGEVIEPKHRTYYGPRTIPGLETFHVRLMTKGAISAKTYVMTRTQYAEAIDAWASVLDERGYGVGMEFHK